MAKTRWTEDRLAKLFHRYNRLYWRGRLPKYTIRISAPPKGETYVGLCKRRERLIIIDVMAHRSDREIRSTLLHEMAHAADTGRGPFHHGYKFWAEIEKLLAQSAPIQIGFPEVPQLEDFHNAIPKRFPRARQKMNRVAAIEMSRIVKEHAGAKFIDMTNRQYEDFILRWAKDAAMEVASWDIASRVIEKDFGLFDIEMKPQNAYARRLLFRAKRVFLRERREFLSIEKSEKLAFDFAPDWFARNPNNNAVSPKAFYSDYVSWCEQRNTKPGSFRFVQEYLTMLRHPRNRE